MNYPDGLREELCKVFNKVIVSWSPEHSIVDCSNLTIYADGVIVRGLGGLDEIPTQYEINHWVNAINKIKKVTYD